MSVLLFAHQVLAPRGPLHLGTTGPEGQASSRVRIQDAIGKSALASLGRRRPRPDVAGSQPVGGNVRWVWATWCVVVVSMAFEERVLKLSKSGAGLPSIFYQPYHPVGMRGQNCCRRPRAGVCWSGQRRRGDVARI